MNPLIPASRAEITPSWLSSVLEASAFPEIVDVLLERLGEDDSVTGYVFRAHLTFRGPSELPASVVVKLPIEAARRTEIQRVFYAREVGFYRELSHQLGEYVPIAYYHALDEPSGDFVLVLEDFRGMRPGDNDRGATPSEAIALVRMMARIHARWWMNPQLVNFSFLVTQREFNARVGARVDENISLFFERYGDILTPEQVTLFERLPAAYSSAVSPLTQVPYTLGHGDLSTKNTLVDGPADAPRFVIFDWQQAGAVPGVRDLSFYIRESIPPDGGRTEQALLHEYHSTLLGEGVTGYGFSQFEEDYRRSVICDFGRSVAFGTSPNALAPAITKKSLARSQGRVSALGLLDLLKA